MTKSVLSPRGKERGMCGVTSIIYLIELKLYWRSNQEQPARLVVER